MVICVAVPASSHLWWCNFALAWSLFCANNVRELMWTSLHVHLSFFACFHPPAGVTLPSSSQTIYSYFVDLESGKFLSWDLLVPKTQSLIEKSSVLNLKQAIKSGEMSYTVNELDLVPTVDTIRYMFLSTLLVNKKKPVLILGKYFLQPPSVTERKIHLCCCYCRCFLFLFLLLLLSWRECVQTFPHLHTCVLVIKTGESGTGKSTLVKNMMSRLSEDDSTSYKNGTLMGSVFNFTDKNQALLDNLYSLAAIQGARNGFQSWMLHFKDSSQSEWTL